MCRKSISNADIDNKPNGVLYNQIKFEKGSTQQMFQLKCPRDTHDPGFDSKHLFSVDVRHQDLIFELYYCIKHI